MRILVISLMSWVTLLAAPIQWSENGHWYDLSVGYGTWHAMNGEAVSRGGYLVSITSQAEQDFVWATFWSTDPSARRWIGFTDEGHEGLWGWTSGEPVTYTNWYFGEPNNLYGEEHFGEIGTYGPALGGAWNDMTVGWNLAGVTEWNEQPEAVPEPESWILLTAGLGVLAAANRCARRSPL